MLVSCYYYSILVLDAIRYINCSLFSIEFVKQSLPTAGVLLWTNKDAFLLEVILVLETTDLTEMQPCLFIKWFQYHAESLCKYLDCVWWWKIAFTTVTTSYVTKLSCDSLMYNGICYCLIYVDVYLFFFTRAILYPNQLCFALQSREEHRDEVFSELLNSEQKLEFQMNRAQTWLAHLGQWKAHVLHADVKPSTVSYCSLLIAMWPCWLWLCFRLKFSQCFWLSSTGLCRQKSFLMTKM